MYAFKKESHQRKISIVTMDIIIIIALLLLFELQNATAPPTDAETFRNAFSDISTLHSTWQSNDNIGSWAGCTGSTHIGYECIAPSSPVIRSSIDISMIPAVFKELTISGHRLFGTIAF